MSSSEPPREPRVMLPVIAAAGTSGVAGYVVLVLAARVLTPQANATFLVFWGALFAIFGALAGLTTETTRAVFSSRGAGRTPVLPAALVLGGGVALVVAGTGWVWAPWLFGDEWLLLLCAMVCGIVLFTAHAALTGAAAGTRRFGAYSFLVGTEAASRLVLCAAAAALGAHLVGLAWAVALACGTWVLWVLTRRDFRALVLARTTGGRTGLVRRMLVACAASGASALLLVGYPVLVRVTTPSDVFGAAAPVILSVSLSRAPLLVPLGVYQNVLVTRVIDGGVRVLRPVLLALLGVAALGSAVAWWLGPWLLRVVNPAYDVSGPVFAALVLAAGLIAVLTLTGAAAVALDRHGAYLAGWLAATVVSVAVLVPPGQLETRVICSLVAGPVVGALVHLRWGLLRRR